jgi:hypothetical protein
MEQLGAFRMPRSAERIRKLCTTVQAPLFCLFIYFLLIHSLAEKYQVKSIRYNRFRHASSEDESFTYIET